MCSDGLAVRSVDLRSVNRRAPRHSVLGHLAIKCICREAARRTEPARSKVEMASFVAKNSDAAAQSELPILEVQLWGDSRRQKPAPGRPQDPILRPLIQK